MKETMQIVLETLKNYRGSTLYFSLFLFSTTLAREHAVNSQYMEMDK